MRSREMNTTSMKSNPTLETVHKPKIKIEYGDDYKFVQDVVSSNNLHTVCERLSTNLLIHKHKCTQTRPN